MSRNELFAQIDKPAYKKWAVDILCRTLAIPSISAQNKGLRESARLLRRMFSSAGFKIISDVIDGNEVILARRVVNPRLPTILFYNHYDVQPPEPLDEWVTPAFKPSIRQGKLFGRGAADNKGNLIARLAAVRAFDNARIPLPVNVSFLIDGREEVGSPGLGAFISRYRSQIKSDMCIWEFGYSRHNGTPVLSLGCKGIMYAEFVATGANADLHSSKGIVVPNPAWHLVWALSSMKNSGEHILIKGFYDRVNFKPINAKQLLGLKVHQVDIKPKQLGLKKLVLGLTGHKLLQRYYYQPCLNINGLSGGYEGKGHKTVLPKQALAKADFRLVPDQTPSDVIRKVRRHLDQNGFGNIKITSWHGYPPALTPPKHRDFKRFVGIIKQAGADVFRRPFEVEPISPASGPMYLFRDKVLGDMPCFALGIGHPGSNIHAPNENIYLSEYFQGIKYITQLMLLQGASK